MNRFSKAVAKAVGRNARTVVIKVKSSPAYVPGGTVTNTVTEHSLSAARVTDRLASSNNGQFVIKDVVLFYLEKHDGVVFKVNDVVVDAGEEFIITKVEKHYAAGELVLYILHC